MGQELGAGQPARAHMLPQPGLLSCKATPLPALRTKLLPYAIPPWLWGGTLLTALAKLCCPVEEAAWTLASGKPALQSQLHDLGQTTSSLRAFFVNQGCRATPGAVARLNEMTSMTGCSMVLLAHSRCSGPPASLCCYGSLFSL